LPRSLAEAKVDTKLTLVRMFERQARQCGDPDGSKSGRERRRIDLSRRNPTFQEVGQSYDNP